MQNAGLEDHVTNPSFGTSGFLHGIQFDSEGIHKARLFPRLAYGIVRDR
jgi:hypothetical protein